MIDRLYAKDLLGFEIVDLSFERGLVVLSGPSGAGKSVLMGSVLASFGLIAAEARLCEIEMKKPTKLYSDAYEIEDELVIRTLKKERIAYYLNDQKISKKSLQKLFSPYVHYLSVRERSGFESDLLIAMLDQILLNKDTLYKEYYIDYQKRYRNYREKLAELTVIQEREDKLCELIEFTTFEINKIKDIAPKPGEDEALIQLKKQLSRIDKIHDALKNAEAIFGLEEQVSEVFRLMGKEGNYFFDTMNQLRADFEETQSLAEELEDTDVEALLDRLEKITELKNRYGSIEEALAYLLTKEQELASYKRTEEDKGILASLVEAEYQELSRIANDITQTRIKTAEIFAIEISESLSRLKLPPVTFSFGTNVLNETGMDTIDLVLSGSSTATLSGGEYNRLRLALMVASLGSGEHEGGVIILDEIDANVSGDESIAIAELIDTLSSAYQIFAISHQPHLAAKAKQHILIDRREHNSTAEVLDTEGRVKEISRIIGGEIPNIEAVAFAKRLLNASL